MTSSQIRYTSFRISILLLLLLHATFATISDLANSPESQPTIERKDVANGSVYTFVKTDRLANIKWGVRHFIPRIRNAQQVTRPRHTNNS
ncbi:hypothetical protein KM043_003878 [Ampulex compressa]|nr:hypothetical protein KM043_003878 [Ampulex compressa]